MKHVAKRIFKRSQLFLFITIFSASSLLLITGCAKYMADPTTLCDMAWNVNKTNYIVMIKETVDDTVNFIPYYVCTDNYNGSALLVRSNVSDDSVIFNVLHEHGAGGSYYADSSLDKYLTNDFYNRIDDNIKNYIINEKIVITTYNGAHSGGKDGDVETIERKIFALSATELNVSSNMSNDEGNKIAFFKSADNIKATKDNGNAANYWLRSSYLWDSSQAWAIS